MTSLALLGNQIRAHPTCSHRYLNLPNSPDISLITCCDHGYGRPSERPWGSAPATYRLGTPRNQSRGAAGRLPGGTPIFFALAALRSVPQAGSQFRGLATAIHEISGLTLHTQTGKNRCARAIVPPLAGAHSGAFFLGAGMQRSG